MANILAAVCALGFIVVLGLSAWSDPTIRVLHAFETIPYALAAWLLLRRRTFGSMLGMAAGGLWLVPAAIRTTFVRNGFEQVAVLWRTGTIPRPDVLIAAPAAVCTAGLVLCSLWAYARSGRRSWGDLVRFGLAAGAVYGYFLAIMALLAPRFLRLFL